MPDLNNMDLLRDYDRHGSDRTIPPGGRREINFRYRLPSGAD